MSEEKLCEGRETSVEFYERVNDSFFLLDHDFSDELIILLNKYNLDGLTNTKDFILAENLVGYMKNLAIMNYDRDKQLEKKIADTLNNKINQAFEKIANKAFRLLWRRYERNI